MLLGFNFYKEANEQTQKGGIQMLEGESHEGLDFGPISETLDEEQRNNPIFSSPSTPLSHVIPHLSSHTLQTTLSSSPQATRLSSSHLFLTPLLCPIP